MIATIWRFRVLPVAVDSFERIYGLHDDWARLFARAVGYVGTELLQHDRGESVCLTIDRWQSADDYHRAKVELALDHAALDCRCEPLASEGNWLGLHAVLV